MNKVFSRLMKALSKNPAVKRLIEAGRGRLKGFFTKGKMNLGRFAKQVQIGGTRLFKKKAVPTTTALTIYDAEFASVSGRGWKAGKSSFFRRHKKQILAGLFGAGGIAAFVAMIASRKNDDDPAYSNLDLMELQGSLEAQRRLYADGREAIAQISNVYNAMLAQAANGGDVNQVLVAKAVEGAALLVSAADCLAEGSFEYFNVQLHALQHGRSLDRDYRLINMRAFMNEQTAGIAEAYLYQSVSDIMLGADDLVYRNDL